MRMSVSIEFQERHTISTRIKEILEIITQNMSLLLVLSQIDIEIEMRKKQKSKYDKNEITESILADFKLAGEITDEQSNKFLKLWAKAEIENQLGKLLEEIIAHLGPYNKVDYEYRYSRESVVKETGRDSNFDVVFYDPGQSTINTEYKTVMLQNGGEFHECKKNVCNVIPCDENLLDIRFKGKLDFIKEVHDLSNNGLFYIPTLKYNVRGSEDFLNKNGYEFIEILSINKIIQRYCS